MRRLLAAVVTLGALVLAGAAQANSTSSNWSGYVASGTGRSFTDVKGTWVQPSVTCAARQTAYSSFWVGLGGASFSSRGLEQIGTSADCRNGVPAQSAWYEILPKGAVTIPLVPAAGDTITAEVSVVATEVTLTLTDTTTGATFTTTATVAAPDTSSADWIAEAPSQCLGRSSCLVLPLATFGTAAFSAASATANGHTGVIADTAWTSGALDLRGRTGSASATAGALGADGASFAIAAVPTGDVIRDLTRVVQHWAAWAGSSWLPSRAG